MASLPTTGASERSGAAETVAPLLDVRGVTMRYRGQHGRDVTALADVNLHVAEGEFVALVGPSGCGKSTLLSVVAGLETPTAGTVALRGDPAARRLGRVGYMPQRDLLLPWRTALGNAIAGLEVQGVSKAEAQRRARTFFETFDLSGFERSYPPMLSGGMRQRVAFARTALAARELLLLDEPFGALDALTRAGLQRWLLDIWGQLGTTCLLVTHDVEEALLLADRVYALTPRPGRVRLELCVPLGRPRQLDMLARPELAAMKAQLLAALVDDAGLAPEGAGNSSQREGVAG